MNHILWKDHWAFLFLGGGSVHISAHIYTCIYLHGSVILRLVLEYSCPERQQVELVGGDSLWKRTSCANANADANPADNTNAGVCVVSFSRVRVYTFYFSPRRATHLRQSSPSLLHNVAVCESFCNVLTGIPYSHVVVINCLLYCTFSSDNVIAYCFLKLKSVSAS